MKKVLSITLVAGLSLVAPTASHAATKAPKPKITGTAAKGDEEGTAAHEQGESSSTQNTEAKKSGMKSNKKKVVVKKK